MNREIKNNGDYLEVDADQLLENIEVAKKAKILVITKARLELSGEDKDAFFKKFEQIPLPFTTEVASKINSDCIFRKMVLD